MSLTVQENNDFMELFAGNTESYGRHIPNKEDIQTGEKRKGQSFTIKNLLTLQDYNKHLTGQEGLGIVPLNKKNEVKFIAIDIDNYDDDYIKQMVTKVYTNNLPFIPFRSKSGGLHLYLFFDKFYEYKPINVLVKEFIPVLGLTLNIEIFPKQLQLKQGQSGNWINLPYFDYTKTKQYLISPSFESMNLTNALMHIKNNLLSYDSLKLMVENLVLMDAPPCLQHIYYKRQTVQRNEYLFNLATFLKNKHDDNFEYEIQDYNDYLYEPLPEKEIQDTIVNSHKKKDYSYKCTQSPIKDICIKEICKNRKFGICGDEVSQLSFEDFIQHRTDPPYYEWIVNGVSLTFFNEIDIINQQRFRELCFRKLNILPFRLKDTKWTEIINRALSNIVIKDISLDEDLSPGSIFMNHLYEFLENRIHAESYSQILMDRVFKEVEGKAYIFKGKDFVHYLYHTKNFRYFKVVEIQDRLKRLQGESIRIYIDKDNKGIRVWRLPFKAIEDFMENPCEGISIDFTKMEDYSEDQY